MLGCLRMVPVPVEMRKEPAGAGLRDELAR